MGRGAWQGAGALALGTWLGCGSTVFLCQDDAGCVQGEAQGICQPTGYCSFPDPSCESGQRYGELAGGTLAGACVEPEVATAVGTGDSGPTGDPTMGDRDTTGPDPDGGTTSPVDDSGPLDTGPGPTTGDPPTTDEGTTGPSMGECRLDEFDDGTLDPQWCPNVSAGIELSEHDGRLWFDLVPTQWPDGDQDGDIHSCDVYPLLGTMAITHAEQMPQVSPYTEAFLDVGNDSFRLSIAVLGGNLVIYAYDNGSWGQVGTQPYEPKAQHFWRIYGAEQGLVAEVSPDGASWAHVYTLARDLSGQEGRVYLGVWGEMVPLGPDAAAFESLEICMVSN